MRVHIREGRGIPLFLGDDRPAMRHPIHLGVLNNKSEQRKNLICRYISKVHYVESANYVCASEGQRLWYFPNSSVLSVRKAWETRGIP